MPTELETPAPTTTDAPIETTAEPIDPFDGLGDPDLNDPNSDAYAREMGDEAPLPDDPAVVADPTQQAEPDQTLWRRDGSKFVKYEAPKMDPPKVEPWKANIYGKEVEAIAGVLKNANGDLFIPKDRVGDLNRQLAHATKYPEVQQMRQERAKERTAYSQREAFQGEKFAEILKATVLDPSWMEWAAASPQNYQTAQMQVETRLRSAQVELREQHGVLSTTKDDGQAGLDPYEGEAAVTSFLSELLQSPDYHGMTAADAEAVLQTLRTRDVPLFHQHPEHGWQMDERPIRALMDGRKGSRSTTATQAAPVPKVDQTNRRNTAAVPTSTAPVPPKTPIPPKDKYADKPWENPALSFAEKRKLYRKAKGFDMPGSD